jgi:hypothetical protein
VKWGRSSDSSDLDESRESQLRPLGSLCAALTIAALTFRDRGVSALLTEVRDFDRFPGLRTERL